MRLPVVFLSSLCCVAGLGVAALADGAGAPPAPGATASAPAQTAPVIATAPQPDMATSDAPQAVDGDKVVCKILAPPTGTRLGGRKVCRTQRQWDAILEKTKQTMDDLHKMQGGSKGG